MVTFNPHELAPGHEVSNEKHQHAFILVGEEQLFGVHMTQFHCELHKYQIILKLGFPKEIYTEFTKLRRAFPNDSFVLCNAKDPEPAVEHQDVRSFSIPELGSGRVSRFTGNVFQGIRPLSDAEIAADSHFFPWAKKYAKPALGEFEVEVERIVTFRPFDHLHDWPEFATYLLFGDSDSGEAHMTNLQTARLVTDAFEPQVFGPDYDHVMSLASAPDWLQDSMLDAGIVVSTPRVRLLDPDSGKVTLPASHPFAEDSPIEVLYRGIGPTRTVVAGPSFLYCTKVCNSPRFFVPRPDYDSYLASLPAVPETCEFTPMPKRYWAFPDDAG